MNRRLSWLPIAASVLAASLAVSPAPVFGQTEDVVALTRKVVETERQAIVAENLQLTDVQGQTFWPLYREYMGERAKIGDRTVQLIRRYAASYQTMDDATATSLVDEYFRIQKDELALKQRWAGKLRKVLPGTTVARFCQIESKLDAAARVYLADEIPLIRDGKEAKIAPAD